MDIVFADWVVFYLVRTGFDCFLKETTNSGVLSCLDTFVFLPWCMLGVLVFFVGVLWLLGAGGLLGVWFGRAWCGSGGWFSGVLDEVKFWAFCRGSVCCAFSWGRNCW